MHCIDQLQSADDIALDELDQVAFGAPKASSRPKEGGMDDRVTTGHQRSGAIFVVEFALQPLDSRGNVFQTKAVTCRSIPAAQCVA